MRQQRDQLDRTALALTAARAAIDLRVNQAQLEKMKEELLAAQKELATRTEERETESETHRSGGGAEQAIDAGRRAPDHPR